MRPVISCSARRGHLAPNLPTHFLNRHPHPVLVSTIKSEIFHKESWHISVDWANPVIGFEPKQRANENSFLIVGRVKSATKSATLLLLDKTNIKIACQIELLKHLQAVFSRQQTARFHFFMTLRCVCGRCS